MTEQEIIDFLKKNKETGIAFAFMPKEVKEWCCNRPNYFNGFLLYKNGAWRDDYCFVNPTKDMKEMALEEIIILALPDSFQIKQEQKGEWVEFGIDRDGCYRILDTDMRFHWSEWNKPLWIYEKDENRRWYLTTFGGWQYEASKPPAWFLAPQIENDNGFCDAHFADDGECKPAIPIKIRFWRENK